MQFVATEVAQHLPTAIARVSDSIGVPADRWDKLTLDLLPHVVADATGTAPDSTITLRIAQQVPGATERIAHESLLGIVADLLVEAYVTATGRALPAVSLFPLVELNTSNLPPYRRPHPGSARVYCLITGLVTD